MSEPPKLSIVIPVRDGESVLPLCLDGLEASDFDHLFEVIVVDDCSRDATPLLARSRANQVVTIEDGPRGPGHARNRGAEVATGEWLVFIDADVVVHPDTLSQISAVATSNPEAAAVFGTYDDNPRAQNFLSQYRNLYHRWVHLRGAGRVSTFWAGCGAVRRDAFLEVGGFDALAFPRPAIEDIELGYRLRARGYGILLSPEIEARHLKRWMLVDMVRTDLFQRAIPWMRLALASPIGAENDALNLRAAEKAKTGIVAAALLAGIVLLVTMKWEWALVSGGALAGVFALNSPLYVWFARLRGPWFALRVVPMNLIYYAVSVLGAVVGTVIHVSDLLRIRVGGVARKSERAPLGPAGGAFGAPASSSDSSAVEANAQKELS